MNHHPTRAHRSHMCPVTFAKPEYMVRRRCVGQRKANMKHAQDVFPKPYLTLYLNESSANIHSVNEFPEITRVFFDSPTDS